MSVQHRPSILQPLCCHCDLIITAGRTRLFGLALFLYSYKQLQLNSLTGASVRHFRLEVSREWQMCGWGSALCLSCKKQFCQCLRKFIYYIFILWSQLWILSLTPSRECREKFLCENLQVCVSRGEKNFSERDRDLTNGERVIGVKAS